MSSATPYSPSRIKKMLDGLATRILEGAKSARNGDLQVAQQRIARLGLSRRQQDLNWLYAWYACENYSTRKCDWSGREQIDPIEHEAIAMAGSIPPGFYDAGATFPLKFRKPTAPYGLVRTIVNRFTGMLFSEARHPTVRDHGDPDSDDFVQALVEETGLWALMRLARKYGGAMGSVAMSFQFVEGKPLVEVHDPRWCKSKFADPLTHEVTYIEKRYMYPVEELDTISGGYKEVWYWYRRIIDAQRDVLYKKTPVAQGDEPDWEVEKEVYHGLEFCPVIWIQNIPVQDDVDGESDCHGIYEKVEMIDALKAQADKGTLKNCDPTVVISSTDLYSEVLKGSDNAIKLSEGDAKYMEITGAGIKAAYDSASIHREEALEVAQCVIERPTAATAQKTATEIMKTYESMIAKADDLRFQYGQQGVLLFLNMMLRAIRKLGESKLDEDGNLVKQVITLPPKVTHDADGNVRLSPRKLGRGTKLSITWPRYFQPSLTDIGEATRASGMAKTMGLIDSEHAVNFAGEFFHVEDPKAMMKRIDEEKSDTRSEMEAEMATRIKIPKI